LQRRRFETFNLDGDLSAARRPDTEMDAAFGLRLGTNRQTPDGRRFGPNQMFRSGGAGRRHELPSLVREANAQIHSGTRVHVATSSSPYGLLPCARGCLTISAVIRSSLSISDATRSGSCIVAVDRTTLRTPVAI
jgi:hypothetical protein